MSDTIVTIIAFIVLLIIFGSLATINESLKD